MKATNLAARFLLARCVLAAADHVAMAAALAATIAINSVLLVVLD